MRPAFPHFIAVLECVWVIHRRKQSSSCILTGFPKVKLLKTAVFVLCESCAACRASASASIMCFNDKREGKSFRGKSGRVPRLTGILNETFFFVKVSLFRRFPTNRTSFTHRSEEKCLRKCFIFPLRSENEITALSCGRHRSKLWCFPTSRINHKSTHKNYCYAEYSLHTRVGSISGCWNVNASLQLLPWRIETRNGDTDMCALGSIPRLKHTIPGTRLAFCSPRRHWTTRLRIMK